LGRAGVVVFLWNGRWRLWLERQIEGDGTQRGGGSGPLSAKTMWNYMQLPSTRLPHQPRKIRISFHLLPHLFELLKGPRRLVVAQEGLNRSRSFSIQGLRHDSWSVGLVGRLACLCIYICLRRRRSDAARCLRDGPRQPVRPLAPLPRKFVVMGTSWALIVYIPPTMSQEIKHSSKLAIIDQKQTRTKSNTSA
jgi:hypothetical protein